MFATRLCLKAWKPTWGSFFAVTGRSQFRLTLFGKICSPAVLRRLSALAKSDLHRLAITLPKCEPNLLAR